MIHVINVLTDTTKDDINIFTSNDTIKDEEIQIRTKNTNLQKVKWGFSIILTQTFSLNPPICI